MNSKVSVKNCSTYNVDMIYKYLNESFDYIGGIDQIVKLGENVLLKVNLTGPFEPEQGATTHPSVVSAVIKLIKELGAYPMIADGPASLTSPLEITGMQKIAEEEKIPVFILKDYEKVKLEDSLMIDELLYSSDVLKADKVISIPKMKTHALTLYTGAIKNMFGTVAYEQRKSLHQYKSIEEFSKVLVDVLGVRVPDLVIMDGICGMSGIGPVHGTVENYNMLITSTDAVALDAIAATLMGYDVSDINMIHEAAALNLGEGNLHNIDVDCDYLKMITEKPNIIPHLTERMRERFISRVMGKIGFDENKCVKCRECENGCPGNAIDLASAQKVDHKKCFHCMRCYEVCHRGAIKIIFKKI